MKKILITTLTFSILLVFLMPLGFGVVSSLKNERQLTKVNAPILPSKEKQFKYKGRNYIIYQVPVAGSVHQWALVKKGKSASLFIDPDNLDKGLQEWEGNWRTLKPLWKYHFQWSNYKLAFEKSHFFLLLRNTLMYAILSTFGMIGSSALVAYGFARFQIPFKNLLFTLVLATIILPKAVTMIPLYTIFYKIGWIGTWLPLIVPAFFANGYNVFLLRQFFRGIPKEMNEAATIDGANPLQTYFFIMLPQAKPAIIAAGLFHFFYCWNDFLEPMIYLAGKPNLYPITVGFTKFCNLYTQQSAYIQAASIIACLLPLFIFFYAQKYFMQGVVISGADK
ncbi:MAG: carbohydrate ABC transporter permease [Spirochaetes bacterium]|nr:carbohydrate ABC transporter permease [Spirochaetota bacterium]